MGVFIWVNMAGFYLNLYIRLELCKLHDDFLYPCYEVDFLLRDV